MLFARFFVVLWLCLAALPACAATIDLPSVNVLADPSLSLPLSELARKYSQKNNVTILVVLEPVKRQMERIENGESADIFISPEDENIQELKLRGMLDVYSLKPLLHNRLAIISPVGSRPPQLDFTSKEALQAQLNDIEHIPLLAIEDPVLFSAGRFTAELLEKPLAMEKALIPEALAEPRQLSEEDAPSYPNRITLQETESLFALMDSKQALGITYYTDAIRRKHVRIQALVPESYHTPINYQAAVIAGNNMAPARRFLDYLQTQEAQEIFRKYGFTGVS